MHLHTVGPSSQEPFSFRYKRKAIHGLAPGLDRLKDGNYRRWERQTSQWTDENIGLHIYKKETSNHLTNENHEFLNLFPEIFWVPFFFQTPIVRGPAVAAKVAEHEGPFWNSSQLQQDVLYCILGRIVIYNQITTRSLELSFLEELGTNHISMFFWRACNICHDRDVTTPRCFTSHGLMYGKSQGFFFLHSHQPLDVHPYGSADSWCYSMFDRGNCPILGILDITWKSSHGIDHIPNGWVMFNGDI